MTFRHLMACVAACGLLASCTEPTQTATLPDVVVIVIDTLRADRLSFYGHDRETAPFLASLAARGLIFDNAWATSSWTAPATASIFTGLYPNQHGVRLGLRAGMDRAGRVESYSLNRIPDEVETLATFMRRHGYRTFGASANPNIDARLGFERGFDHFVPFDPASSKSGARLSQEVLALRETFEREDTPYFLYLHFADPHGPYTRHAEWIEPDVPRPTNPLDDIAAYDSEIRFSDEHIRRVFEGLGIGEDTLVIFTADHGQEFLDHGMRGHGWQLYSELTRVPFFVVAPGRPEARGRTDRLVGGIDVLPTVADLIGRPLERGVAGRSVFEPAPDGDTPRFSMRTRYTGDDTTAHIHAVVAGRFKLIVHDPDARHELYDLVEDPGERRDLSGANPALVESLAALIAAQRADAEQHGHRAAQAFTPDAALIEQLEALGYTDGGINTGDH